MQCCPICHASPNMMNLKIFKERFVADGQALCYDISPLHVKKRKRSLKIRLNFGLTYLFYNKIQA